MSIRTAGNFTALELKEINRYGKEKVDTLIKMTKDLHSNREISELVFGRMTMASTVHRIQKAFGIDGKKGVSMMGTYKDKPSQNKTPKIKKIVNHRLDLREDKTNVQFKTKEYKGAKVLFIDIETSYLHLMGYSLFNANFGIGQIEQDWNILSYCAKWAHNDHIIYESLKGVEDKRDDSSLMDSLWDLLDEADYIVAHNGKRFDSKKMKARFLLNGYKPPSPYKVIDTLYMAKNLGMTSNKLEYLTKRICKKHHKISGSADDMTTERYLDGMTLWIKCMNDDKAAWDKNERYNIGDVTSLEELYHELAPWTPNLINMNVWYTNSRLERCSACGGFEFKENGFVTTNKGKYVKMVCQDCGRSMRGNENLNDIDKRKSTLNNIPV